MKKFFMLTAVLSLSFFVASNIYAAGDSAKAQSLVDKAIQMMKKNGKDKAFAEINAGKFKEGDIYIFCYDMNGVIVAHSENKALIGKNMLNVPDLDGKMFRKDIVETAKSKGSGWVDYKYKNPSTGKIEQKTTYLKKEGDIIFCCGIYK